MRNVFSSLLQVYDERFQMWGLTGLVVTFAEQTFVCAIMISFLFIMATPFIPFFAQDMGGVGIIFDTIVVIAVLWHFATKKMRGNDNAR